MLARITREITATEDLQAVLSSVASALASQPDMIFSRIWLYLSDDRCDWCRAHGWPANALVAPPSAIRSTSQVKTFSAAC